MAENHPVNSAFPSCLSHCIHTWSTRTPHVPCGQGSALPILIPAACCPHTLDCTVFSVAYRLTVQPHASHLYLLTPPAFRPCGVQVLAHALCEKEDVFEQLSAKHASQVSHWAMLVRAENCSWTGQLIVGKTQGPGLNISDI